MAGLQLRKRKEYDALKTKLFTDRQSSMALWKEIADYIKPTRCRLNLTDRNRNDRRNQKILDETATFDLDTLESGLFAGMSSPARQWFKLALPSKSMNLTDAITEYLFEVENRMNAVFSLSNLYNGLPECFGDVSTFGTAAMACFEDSEDLLRFYTYPLGSYAIGLNRRREVCTFVHEDQWTVRQVVEEFAQLREGEIVNTENFSTVVLEHWKQKRYEETVDVCWIVMPNDKANPLKLDAKYLPFTSCFFEIGRQDHEAVLRESGFRTFPVMVPRWKTVSNDSYGSNCPGITVLSAVKQLQSMERKSNQWLDKIVDPALVGPSSLRNQPTSLVAGHITYSDPRDESSRLRPIHELRGEGYQHFEAKAEQVRQRIHTGTFSDLFKMFQSAPYGQPMTAEEVKERHKEKLLILGPALERMNEELLEKIIDRTFDIMAQAGLLPEPPEGIEGVSLKVEFTSVLAEAMKLTRVVTIDRMMSSVLPLAEFFPEVLDIIDPLGVVEEYRDGLGTSPKILRSREEAMARGQQRAEAQQAQAAADQANKVSGAVRNIAQAPMSGDSVLSHLAESVGAA